MSEAPYPVLDARQIKRIEAVHGGFLYQHPYAVGCVLGTGGACGYRIGLQPNFERRKEIGHIFLQINGELRGCDLPLVVGEYLLAAYAAA